MKQVDANGFWNIKNNPISKTGVFPYLGKQIDKSLEPEKVYMVLRPADELFSDEAIESFNENPVPLVDDHTMIGDEYTPAEQKGIDGVVQNIHRDGDTLVGDISIYSKAMKEKITSGKKELSLGYFCTYDLTDGDYNGEHFDAVQRNIRSNHIALVDKGRCGKDVRVFDRWCFDCAITEDEQNTDSNIGVVASSDDANFQSKIEEVKNMIDKEKIAALKELVAMLEGEESAQPEADAKPCDEIPEAVKEENPELVKDEVVDKRELIREIGAIAGKGGLSEEDVRTILEKAEQLAYNSSEAETHDEEEKEIEAPKIEEEKEEKKESEDALPQKIFEMIADRDELAKKVAPIIGNFDHSKMTAEQVAQYACDKLDIKSETPRAAIDGYLQGFSKSRSKMYSIDAGIRTETAQSQIDKYLKGE